MDLFRQKFFHNNPTFRDYTAYLQKKLTPVLRDQEDSILAVVPKIRHQFIVDNIPTDPMYEKIYLDTGWIVDAVTTITREIPTQYYVTEIYGYIPAALELGGEVDITLNNLTISKNKTLEDQVFQHSGFDYPIDLLEDYYMLEVAGGTGCRLVFVLAPLFFNTPIPDINLLNAIAVSDTKINLYFDVPIGQDALTVVLFEDGVQATDTIATQLSRTDSTVIECLPFKFTFDPTKVYTLSISEQIIGVTGAKLQTVTKFPVTLNIVIPT